MKYRLLRVALVPLVVLLLGLGLAFALSAGPTQSACAQGGTGIVRVAKSGTDAPGCGDATTPCATIQYAVDQAADGEEIRVAQGTYTGTQALVAASASGPHTYMQVALITKSLTLRGGYAPADWSTSVPTQNVTVIDAEGYGRGITVLGTGAQSVTVDGFTITGGDYTGLGNKDGEAWLGCWRTGGDCAGALFAREVAVIVRRCVISGNIGGRSESSDDGGGMYLWDVKAGSRIEDTLFISNTSAGGSANGGGANIHAQGLTVVRSAFIDNYAADGGGGMLVEVPHSSRIIKDCEFTGNVVEGPNGDGGGLYIQHGGFVVRVTLSLGTWRVRAGRCTWMRVSTTPSYSMPTHSSATRPT